MEKMDRNQIVIAHKDELDKKDAEYWRSATIEERLQTITYLRNVFMAKRQLPVDFKEFIQCLNLNDVRFLLVGGWAVGLHGYR